MLRIGASSADIIPYQFFARITAPCYNSFEAWCCGHREEVAMSIDHGDTNKSLGGKRTYTVEEIAKILGIGRTAAYNLAHSGVFKVVRIGSSIRVSKVSFDNWLDKQTL